VHVYLYGLSMLPDRLDESAMSSDVLSWQAEMSHDQLAEPINIVSHTHHLSRPVLHRPDLYKGSGVRGWPSGKT